MHDTIRSDTTFQLQPIQAPKLSATSVPVHVERAATRIDPLTGVRCIAALLVYASHIAPPLPGAPAWVRTFMLSGFNGVTLFFVLSGFVICHNYYDRFVANARGSIWPFFVARFARIYPVYLLTFFWFFTTEDMRGQLHKWGTLILQQLTITQSWNRDLNIPSSYNAAAWSVSVEAFLYATFPLIAVVLLQRLRTARQLVVCGIVVAAAVLALATWFSLNHYTYFYGDVHWIMYRLPATRLGDFLLGCVGARLFALYAARSPSRLEYAIGCIVLLIALAAVCAIMIVNRPALIPYRFDSAYSLFFAVILFCVARYDTPLSRFLGTRPMVLLGEASFSFYMFHFWVMRSFPLQGVGHVVYLHAAMILGLVTLVALGCYQYVEVPLRRLIRRSLIRRSAAVQQQLLHTTENSVPASAD